MNALRCLRENKVLPIMLLLHCDIGYGSFLRVLCYVHRVSPGTQMEVWPQHFLLRETALTVSLTNHSYRHPLL